MCIQDLKLVQASVDAPGRFVVVTRYKKDYLHFSRRGGKITSNVDARLVIQANSGTFRSRENFVVQVRYLVLRKKKYRDIGSLVLDPGLTAGYESV